MVWHTHNLTGFTGVFFRSYIDICQIPSHCSFLYPLNRIWQPSPNLTSFITRIRCKKINPAHQKRKTCEKIETWENGTLASTRVCPRKPQLKLILQWIKSVVFLLKLCIIRPFTPDLVCFCLSKSNKLKNAYKIFLQWQNLSGTLSKTKPIYTVS